MSKQHKKYFGNPKDDDGDLVLFSHEPYAIEDSSLIDKVIEKRKENQSVTFTHKGVRYEIKSYIKGNVLSRTLVENLDR
jgi:hypothetical protein